MPNSSRSKVRYAVVGLGHIAQVAVLPAFKGARNSELFALVSGDRQKLTSAGRKYKTKHLYSYDNYSRALANVDAVYLALPNHLHREYAVRAAAAGVHVLCEKPMAVSVEDCLAMIHAARQNGVKLMIAYRLHFEAASLKAIEIGRSGKLGELRFFTSEFSQQVRNGNVRIAESVARGGGPVYDMGVYCINASRNLFGTEPIEVLATAANKSDPRFQRTEEMASVLMRFPEEKIAMFTCSFGASDVSRLSLVGTKGELRMDPAYEYAEGLRQQLKIGAKKTSRSFPKRDQFAGEIAHFSDCILRGKTPEPAGEEGMADVRIIEAIYESLRTKRAVQLEPSAAKRLPSMRQAIHVAARGEPETVRAPSPSKEVAA